MAKPREKDCTRILDFFAYSYFVRIMSYCNSCLSPQWTWNTRSHRCVFPQRYYSRSKWLHTSAAQNLIFISSSCTLKFRSLFQKSLFCSRWAPSSLLPDSSSFWDMPAPAHPHPPTPRPVFHLMPAKYLDYRTGYCHGSASRVGRRSRVTVQLAARK